LQNPSETNGDNLNNLKKEGILKEENVLETVRA
jgi:hypothetical protein